MLGTHVMKIRVLKAPKDHWYADNIGEVFTVMERSLDGDLPKPWYYYVEHPKNDRNTAYFVEKEDCEIVTEPNALDLIANLSAEVVRLNKRVEALEKAQYIESKRSEIKLTGPKSIKPLTREEVIEKAKADIEALKTKGDGPEYYRVEGQPVTGWAGCNVKFAINREKRTVVALMYGRYTNMLYAKGIAKFAPDDCFNVHIGKAIALRRALGLDVPEEYVNAPQPTEAKVGDVVIGARDGKKYRVVKYRKSMNETELGSLNCNGAKVIDDSDRE